MFESQNPGLWYTPDRYQTFSTLADAVFSALDFPTAARKWGGSVLALEALIDKVAPPPESPEERAARLQVSVCLLTCVYVCVLVHVCVCLPCACPCACPRLHAFPVLAPNPRPSSTHPFTAPPSLPITPILDVHMPSRVRRLCLSVRPRSVVNRVRR